MLWLERPHYLRWTLVGLLILTSLWLELRPANLTNHPFLTRDLAAGNAIEEAVAWREIPDGVLPPVEPTGFAARPLTSGQPLLLGDTVATATTPPAGWWIVEVEVPRKAAPGSQIQLVVLPEPGHQSLPPIGGLAVDVRPPTYEGGAPVASVALPPDRAATAAAAIADQRVSVLIQPP